MVSVSKYLKDTAFHVSVSKIHFQPTFLMVSVSKLKDPEDTAFHVSAS